MEQNIQLYGRNDMVMLQDNKIYGSLGLAEKYIVKTKQGTPPLLLDSSLKSKFLGMNIYGKSTQETTDGVNVYAGGSVTKTWENAEDGSINVNIGNAQILLQCGDVFQRGGFLLFDSDINVPIEAVVSFKGYDVNNWGNEATQLYIKAGYNKVILPKYNFIDGQEKVQIQIRKNSKSESPGVPYTFTLSNIMVKAGQEAHDYEPYTGGMPSPNPDYPQEIKSIGDSGSIDISVTGANLFDFENVDLRQWYISTQGIIGSYSKNYCFVMKVMPNKKYHLKDRYSNPLRYALFSEYPAIGMTPIAFYAPPTVTYSDLVIETTENIQYILIQYLGQFESAPDLSGIMFSLIDTTYEPYKQPQTMVISTPNGLNGIPVSSGGNYTDENGQQWVCDEVDFKRGVYIRNIISRTFDGSGTMDSNGGIVNGFFRCRVSFPEIPSEGAIDGLCDKFIKGAGDMEMFSLGYRILYLWIDISRLNGENSTMDDVRKFLNNNPVTVYAKRETPIETPLTDNELSAYKALHSNYPNTVVDNSEQAQMSVTYKSFENA